MHTEGTDEVIANLESTRQAVDEIIAGEEVDRSTPADIAAGIQAAMNEIEHLRDLTQRQAQTIFDLMHRMDAMVKITEKMVRDSFAGDRNIIDDITIGGTHREKDEGIIAAIRKLMAEQRARMNVIYAIRRIQFPPESRSRHDDDEIPF